VLDSEAGLPPWVLDSGADMPQSEAALRAGLDILATTPESASGVVLSHTHLDHSGGLLRWRPARLLVHENAVQEMRNLQPSSSRGRTALQIMGVPAELMGDLAPEAEPAGSAPFARTPVSDPVSGSEGPIPSSGGWRWILAEGHAPGHLMTFHPEDRVLLVADQFLHRWKTPIRISDPEEDSFGLYMDSLDRALGLQPLIVCSTRGPTWSPEPPARPHARGDRKRFDDGVGRGGGWWRPPAERRLAHTVPSRAPRHAASPGGWRCARPTTAGRCRALRSRLIPAAPYDLRDGESGGGFRSRCEPAHHVRLQDFDELSDDVVPAQGRVVFPIHVDGGAGFLEAPG